MRVPVVQQVAGVVSSVLGRNSRLVRSMRPVYASLLDALSGGRGYLRIVNGTTAFFANPHRLGAFPETYEPSVFQYLRRNVKPGDQSLNVGAHVGVFALGLAVWSSPTGHVWAFEPNPATRKILQDHVQRNRLSDRVSISGDAVSDFVGNAAFFAEAIAGTSRLGEPNPDAHAEHAELRVPVTTVDAFCATRKLTPEWIVLDVEGFEAAALRGGCSTIRDSADIRVVVELHPHLWESAGSSRAEFESVLHGLDLYIEHVLQDQRDPFTDPGVVVLAKRTAP